MRDFAIAAALLLAACGSGAPVPTTTGPLLRAEKAASFRDSEAPGREGAFSPDGRWLATSSASGAPEDIMYLGFSPDGRWLATSADDGIVTVWRLNADSDTG